MLSLLGTIIIGFVVGLIARALKPGSDPMGFIVTTLLGIAGAVIGRYIGLFLGLYTEDQPAGFFMSIVGALILLFIYHLVTKKNTPSA